MSKFARKYFGKFLSEIFVIYFDQLLGAKHTQKLVEIFFNDFPVKKLKKERKSKKIDAKFSKTQCLGCAAPKRRSKYTSEIQPFSNPSVQCQNKNVLGA